MTRPPGGIYTCVYVCVCACGQVIPYFPFKGIPRFYDIGGFLKPPAGTQRVRHLLVLLAQTSKLARQACTRVVLGAGGSGSVGPTR